MARPELDQSLGQSRVRGWSPCSPPPPFPPPPTTHCTLAPFARAGAGSLVARLPQPAWALTPHQVFAVYDGDACLGSALLALPGQTVHEQARAARAREEAAAAGPLAQQQGSTQQAAGHPL